jgi:hypothetical protein
MTPTEWIAFSGVIVAIIGIGVSILTAIGGMLSMIIGCLIGWNVKTTLKMLADAQAEFKETIKGLVKDKDDFREKVYKKIDDNDSAVGLQFQGQQRTINRIDKNVVMIMTAHKIPMSDIDLTKNAYETQA